MELKIKLLLDEVSKAISKYETEILLSGSEFNIFHLLKLGRLEKIHSYFLSELLNPNGSHGQKDKFLKLFIQHCQLEDYDDIDYCTYTKIKTDVYLGIINKEYTQGGVVDILISSNGSGVSAQSDPLIPR